MKASANFIAVCNQRIDAATEIIEQEFSSLSVEDFNRRPDEKNWSVAECIAHLLITNELYIKIFKSVAEKTYRRPFTTYLPLLPDIFGRMLVEGVSPDNEKKIKTFALFTPEQKTYNIDLIQTYKNSQEELKETLLGLEEFDLEKYIISSPISMIIVFCLEDAIELVVRHEVRHINQARNVIYTQKNEVKEQKVNS